MSFLIVVAHPDDEVLGAGATIHRLVQRNIEVNVCIMCGQAEARGQRPSDKELVDDMNACLKKLGVNRVFVGTFPNIRMNTSAHIELVQFIEDVIIRSKAETIITHHPADLNNDHAQTSIACQAAVRLFQRRRDVVPLQELWFMEVLSSTEWTLNTSISDFRPNTYIEVGKEAVELKLEALECYRGVMREYPHPRSKEAIMGLAAYRGAISGCEYAEAFECVFRRVELLERNVI